MKNELFANRWLGDEKTTTDQLLVNPVNPANPAILSIFQIDSNILPGNHSSGNPISATITLPK